MPLWTMLSKSVEDHDGNFIGLANFAEYFTTPALAYSIENSLVVALITTVITVSIAFTYAYALTRSCMPFKGVFKALAMIPDPGAVAAAGHRAGLPVRQPGHAQGVDVRREHLWPHRHRHRRGVLHHPARGADPRDGAVHRRCAPLRGGAGDAREPRADLLHRDPSGLSLRAHQRRLRGVHPDHHRLRCAEGHRRQLQRARHRHLQAGHRPAELRDGRGGERGAAGAGGARLHRGPHRAAQAGGAALGAGGGLRAEPQPRVRPGDAHLRAAWCAGSCWACSGSASTRRW